MKDINISQDIIYIGADDKDIDLFESQYVVPNGISYNSYLIKDEKTAIMDTIDKRRTAEWLDNLEKALEGRKPDYLVVSHLEPDHAYNIEVIAKKYPEMKQEELEKLIWQKIKEINKTFPPYKYIKNMILTDQELIKTTTKKVKRNEEIKKLLDNK